MSAHQDAPSLLRALRSVAHPVAAAALADGELALRTMLRALRAAPATAITQLDALLALAPEVLAPPLQGSSTPQVLPQVYARALAIQFGDAAALTGACAADRVDTYLTSVVLRTLGDGEAVRTDPGLAWQVCRTAAQLAPIERKIDGNACGRVHAICCASLGVDAAHTAAESGQIAVEAACMLAISLCDIAPKSGDTATLCKALFPRALALVDAADSSAALIISDLLPRLLDSLPTERPTAHAQLGALFMDLVSADGDRRASGLALGCRFAGHLLEDLRRDGAFWTVLRECLVDTEDLCRKRALFLLQAAAQGEPAGASASRSADVDVKTESGGNRSKTGGKKAGKRGRRNQGKVPQVAPGWPQFIWAFQAIETSTEALSPAWVQAVEELGRTAKLTGGPDVESALQLDVEPWVQLLLALGLRHRHPKVQQIALHAALRGTAYNERHDALSNGDEFVLACCDLLSSTPIAASMLRDVRAIEANTTAWPFVVEVHAFMNRHVQQAPGFLRRWVHWFAARFSPSVIYPAAAMLVWLQWLRELASRQHGSDPRAGLHEPEVALLAGVVTGHDTPASLCADRALSVLARQTVLAACVKLLSTPLDAPLAALAPILAWASPCEIVAELGCCDDGAGITALDWIRNLGPTDVDPMEYLTQRVKIFLTADEQSTMSVTEVAQSLATSILLLCDGVHAQSYSSIDSIIGPAIATIEEAHAHPYQAPGRKERAVILVARLIVLATPESPVHRRLQTWVAAESTAAAVNSALRPALLIWAKDSPTREHSLPNGVDDALSSAAQARADRQAQLQGAGDSGCVTCTAASSLTLLGWITEQSSTGALAARTISDALACLTLPTGNPAHLQIALDHLTQQLKNTVKLINTESLLARLNASGDDDAGWWRCLSALASQPGVPTAAALRVLQAAGTALENAPADPANDIIRGVGTALTWLLGSAHNVLADAQSEEVTACIEKCLRTSWCTWRTHLQGVRDGDFAAQSVLLLNVQSILHKGLMALPAWSAPTSAIREIFREMWNFSASFTDLAPVLTWHCCSVWSQYPSIARLYCEQAADMVCYTKTECHQASDAVAVHSCENELLTRGMLLLYLENISVAHAESLGAPMLRAVMALTKAPVHRTPSREYELNSPTHKVKTSVWQALCVLVQVVAPNTPLASEMHDSAVELAAWEHFPSERQYLDLFMLRLLGRCPELISRWLPAALANYELRPQIAQGILLVAGFVLLRLGHDSEAQLHLPHFKSLFPSMVTWVNSGHRQLRSLAQVLVVRLVADCKTRAQLTRDIGDDDSATEYDSVGADEQLMSLHSYLASATEGGAFRDRLSTIVSSFDAEVRQHV